MGGGGTIEDGNKIKADKEKTKASSRKAARDRQFWKPKTTSDQTFIIPGLSESFEGLGTCFLFLKVWELAFCPLKGSWLKLKDVCSPQGPQDPKVDAHTHTHTPLQPACFSLMNSCGMNSERFLCKG